MSLPVPELPTSSVDIDGVAVPIRSLTRDEVGQLAGMEDDTAKAEAFTISAGCGITEAEALDWRRKVTAPTAQLLITEIAVLSGLRTRKDATGKA